MPADVLRQAKVLLLQQIPLSESSVSAIARGFLARTNNDLPLDEPTASCESIRRDDGPAGAGGLRQMDPPRRPGADHRRTEPEVVMHQQKV